MAFPRFLQALLVAAMVLNSQVYGQITTPCTAPLTNMVTPCMNFLTNSSGNGTSPTAGCCNALKSLTSTGFDCVCLLLTASVPFQLPINRTVAASLPRACNMPGVPVQCKGAAGAPLPAPGPGPAKGWCEWINRRAPNFGRFHRKTTTVKKAPRHGCFPISVG